MVTDFTYTVEDYPNAESTDRTVSIVLFYRRLTVSWSGPLSRNACQRRDREHAEFRERYAYLYEDGE